MFDFIKSKIGWLIIILLAVLALMALAVKTHAAEVSPGDSPGIYACLNLQSQTQIVSVLLFVPPGVWTFANQADQSEIETVTGYPHPYARALNILATNGRSMACGINPGVRITYGAGGPRAPGEII